MEKPSFDFEELRKKDKAELETMKLALDIYQAEDKFNFERRKFRTENLRYILIAVMTSVISLGSSYIIEYFKKGNTERADAKKEFVDLKKQYLLEKDKNKQIELACALAGFDDAFNDTSIEVAKRQYDNICKSAHIIEQEGDKVAKAAEQAGDIKEVAAQVDGLEQIKQNLTAQQSNAPASPEVSQRIVQVSKQIDSLVRQHPALATVGKSTEAIERQTRKIETAKQSISNNTSNFAKGDIVWFKTGYFLHFGEYRVLLQYLDPKLGIQVEVCKTAGSGRCESPLLTKAWVRFDAPLQFSDNGRTYRISLEAIDYAGSNPFKKAAYVTFDTAR